MIKVKTTSRDPVTSYARNVVSGKIIAGPHVRHACQRHLDDLEQAPSRGFFFDLEKVKRAIGFYQDVLRLNGGQYEGKPYILLDWQKFIVGSLFGWVDSEGLRRFRVAYVETAKGSGKSPLSAGIGLYGLVADAESRAECYAVAPLALDTVVPTPSGFTTQGNLRVGDTVFDENGKPCRVTYLSPILYGKPCYEIEFDDGTKVISDVNHQWRVTDTRGQNKRWHKDIVITTGEMIDTLKTQRGCNRYKIPIAGPLDLPEIALPIDPYTLGVWLGDGRSNRGSVCYHRHDHNVLDGIKSAGYIISQMVNQNDVMYCTIRRLRTQLSAAGLLDNKHIPSIYLRASIDQRISLLKGLMTTDGTCTKTGECKFTNRNKKLAEGVYELAISLGIKPHLGCITVTSAPHWRVSFKAPKHLDIFALSRKSARQIDSVNYKAKSRYIKNIKPCDSVPVRCISVDSENNLYLITRSNIATHNTKKDQAMILFRDAVAMVDQSPQLSKALSKSGVGQMTWNLAYHRSGSFFRPISSDDGQSGPRPHIALIDEIHEHKTNIAVEMMRAGTKSRRQALIFMITNSGSDRTGPCWQYHEYATRIASRQLEDDSFFSYVCGLDEGDDPFADERCWDKVNPSLKAGIPGKRYIREQVNEARGMPSKEALVRRLNFCQWTDAKNPWISADVWMAAKRNYDWRSLRGRRAWGGLDLGSTTDLTGLVLWIEPEEYGQPWQLATFAWLPEDDLLRKEELDKVPYLVWKSSGYLETTPGRAVSRLAVLRRIAELQNMFDIQCIAFDRWRIEDLKQLAEDEDIPLPPMEPFGQGYKEMSPALDKFEAALLNGEVVHDGNPILTWNAANAVTVQDAAENRKLSKEKATGRIDLIVAAVMGAGIAIGNQDTGNIDDFINTPLYA